MKFIAIPQMIIALIFYCIHYLLRIFIIEYNFTIIRWHIASVLALIVCIPIFVNSQIIFRIRKTNYITIVDIIIYFILFSLYFEIIGPKYIKNFTGDIIDIVGYGIGGIILYFSQSIIRKKYLRIQHRITKL